MPCTFTHVLESFGSNTNPSVDFLEDSSTMLKNLRTLIYLHSLSLPASVRAPNTSVPFPKKKRMALMDFPATASTFNASSCDFVNVTAGASTLLRLTFAGAFHTPRVLSTIAYTPAIAPLGGMLVMLLPMPARMFLYTGKESAREVSS